MLAGLVRLRGKRGIERGILWLCSLKMTAEMAPMRASTQPLVKNCPVIFLRYVSSSESFTFFTSVFILHFFF